MAATTENPAEDPGKLHPIHSPIGSPCGPQNLRSVQNMQEKHGFFCVAASNVLEHINYDTPGVPQTAAKLTRQKENKTRLIKLEDVDSAAVQAMLYFMYRSDYNKPKNTSAMLFHARVYALADRYMVPDLKLIAASKFKAAFNQSCASGAGDIVFGAVFDTLLMAALVQDASSTWIMSGVRMLQPCQITVCQLPKTSWPGREIKVAQFPEDLSQAFSALQSGLPSPLSLALAHNIAPSVCHIRNFGKVVDALKLAANRASSTPGLSRYTSVHTLLLQWEFDDLGVSDEVQRLSDVLRLNYGFDVEHWKIPSAKPALNLTQTISDWIERFDGNHNLFVLYYVGHGRIDDGRQVFFGASHLRDSSHDQFAEIKWSTCEDILHKAASDTLFLLDYCYSAGSASPPLRVFSETMAASGFDSVAPPPGPRSFTTTLTRAFSVVKLHAEILVSLKEMPPRHISEGSLFEWRRTPVHYIPSSDLCPPSITPARAPLLQNVRG
ncbi:hypothetical protein B0T26DRAFT_679696 [Lasiosphaeria miniovina]|uniref:BTB domain-containing protein n=1 Tax=Lasiosphaeria miniovina TaxID=1954250 RepID=A0AA39ZYH9_9PEZI|nr:uncharacterized protein B0T26DRAFT_679696 [Lasiosphaeria miniovina]KAK0705929.1 hypothetical protein B0T26DRAFT_679696 [Lasiosphaeria miniovina]